MQVASCPDHHEMNIAGSWSDLTVNMKLCLQLKIQVFWDVTLCHWINTSQHCDDTLVLWNIRNCLCDDMASHSWRLACSKILPKKLPFFIHPFVRWPQHLLPFALHWYSSLRILLSGTFVRLTTHFLQFFCYYVDYCYSKFIISLWFSQQCW